MMVDTRLWLGARLVFSVEFGISKTSFNSLIIFYEPSNVVAKSMYFNVPDLNSAGRSGSS